VFAGFLGHVGTFFGGPIFEDYLPHMYQIFEGSVILNQTSAFISYMRHLSETTEPLPIHFLGVWDTVEEYFPRRDLPAIQNLPTHITHARHALALHERRMEMEPTLWTKWDPAKSTVKQVWFPGAHADVGGGYKDSRLADSPLRWMRTEAEQCELKVLQPDPNNHSLVLHQERTGGRMVGSVISALRGEKPRDAISVSDPKVITSLDVDQTACASLLNPFEQVHFTGGDQAEAKKQLEQVDSKTLTLLLKLRSGGSAESWRAARTMDEVKSCNTIVERCFTSPDGMSKYDFATSLALLVILGGDTTSVSDKLENLEEDSLAAVDAELHEFNSTLLGWNVVFPDRLAASIAKIGRKVEEANKERIELGKAELRRRAKEAQFKLQKPSDPKDSTS
jgi:hypothetical protein